MTSNVKEGHGILPGEDVNSIKTDLSPKSAKYESIFLFITGDDAFCCNRANIAEYSMNSIELDYVILLKILFAGQYCVDGAETGPCTAGFWCKKGNPTAWPYANETDPSIGEPCPYGYYCLEGNV